jgi:Rrf2 family protein
MISQTAEYALRAIVYLANQKGAARTTSQIAEATHVPPGYLAKVMQGLSRTKLVHSQRGLNGGFTLGDDPVNLTVLAIVSAVDPIQRYPECPLGMAGHGRRLCPLHRRLDEAAEMVEKAFAEISVADLVTVPRKQKSLCRFPLEPQTVG